jgi:hypothetical protein
MKTELLKTLQLLHEEVAKTFELFIISLENDAETSKTTDICGRLCILWEEIEKIKTPFINEFGKR